MRNILKYALGTLIGLVSFSIISFVFILIIGALSSSSSKSEIEPNSVLVLNFSKGIVDRAQDPAFDLGILGGDKTKPVALNTLLELLDKAKTDDKIKGILMDMNNLEGSWASIEEVRNGLKDFRTSGKFIMSYSDIYTNKNYYLASVSDEVYMTANGGLVWNGLSRTVMFYKGALEKLGVEVRPFKVGKFKSAVEPYILEKMSDANKAQNVSFMNSFYDHMLEGISEQRGIEVAHLKELADNFSIRDDKGAVEEKLIDALKYKDEVIAKLKENLGLDTESEIEYVSLSKYSANNTSKAKKDFHLDNIAVVFAAGNIVDGKGEKDEIGGATLSKVIREVREDDDVKALVLRVNSPGGSALASEIIWREIALIKERMPVVVSMGDLAASGGYYISCLADSIVAQPNTITGSIGVFGLVPNFQVMLEEKLGLTFDMVETSQYGDFGSLYRAVHDSEAEIIQTSVNRIYDLFLTRVSDGRAVAKEDIHKIAQGRVWTGLQAKENGLVDVIGGLEKAIEIAAEKAKLEDYISVEYPKKDLKPWEMVLEMMQSNSAESFIKEEMGDFYGQYKNIKTISKAKGVQARIPYQIYIE